MKRHLQLILTAAAITLTGCSAGTAEQRAARRFNDEGNKHYSAERYSDAEASYTKAVGADPANNEAKYNLAMSMIRQAGPGESGKKIMDDARRLLTEVWQNPAAPAALASKAAYNIGNMAYNLQQWDPAIASYKQALRFNPDDDHARENLRLAQLKKNDQQDQNQDQNQQNKDQDKEQDKKEDNNDQQDQQQQQPPKQNDPESKEQPQNPRPQGGISDENAEKILKAMENEEAATRRRVQEAEKRKAAATGRRTVTNPW